MERGRLDAPGDLILGAANVNTASTFVFDSARKRMERGHLVRPYADSTIYATALGRLYLLRNSECVAATRFALMGGRDVRAPY